MQAAGMLTALGAGELGWRLLTTRDPAERLTLLAVLKNARDSRAILNAEAWGVT